ncbi:unnamed protein product [Cylindrotheca closterium]|uniref:Uncharacterized protein n=1 Tax=Cylindrotheca closterium TaxID=2856 RepID=A0AAD2FNF2_9STRA|nr:unnamed protein product [Cylindrotheca closterium]
MTDLALFDLRCYPTEILSTILANYCSRRDILSLWLAAIGSDEYVELLWPLLVNYTDTALRTLLDGQFGDQYHEEHEVHYHHQESVRKRRRVPACLQTLIHDELNSAMTPRLEEESSKSSNFETQRTRTGQLYTRLQLIAYHETLHGVLWSGRMEFSIPRNMRSYQEERLTASVKLCCFGGTVGDNSNNNNNGKQHGRTSFQGKPTPDAGGCEKEMQAWSFVNLRAWNTCFPEWLSVVQLRSQRYNFVPIPPYGRLQGISDQDKAIIQRVRLTLEESDHVMTLIVRNNRMILRIISPNQARRRLQAFPSLSNKFQQLAATEGLLCCWERTELWEDELKLGYISKEERLEAVTSILTRYHSRHSIVDNKNF